MAEHESTEVVPTAPATFDLGQPVDDLHGGKEPVTWAGGSLELVEVAEHRPTSALDRDPSGRKWMIGAAGGSVVLALILAFALTRGDDAEADESDDDSQATVEIPSAPPEPEPVAVPVPEPEPTKAKRSKTASRSPAATKSDSTFAAGSEKAAESSASKPAGGASKPAGGASKPAGGASKPAGASKPVPEPVPEPSKKPVGPNLAPPEDEGGGSKAELPDVSGWDDEDAALGDRSGEEL